MEIILRKVFFLTLCFIAALFSVNCTVAESNFEEIFRNAVKEAEEIIATQKESTDRAAAVNRKGKSTIPSHTYVKFNELTEYIGERSNLNLMTYERLLREGNVDITQTLAALALQRPDFCSEKLQDCDIWYRYRRINGTCNNLDNPMWGASYTEMARILPPVYTDGYNGQRGGDGVEKAFNLPNPRIISTTIHSDLIQPDTRITNMLPQFGQYLDHDISLVAEGDKRCCHGVEHVDCWPIQIYANDSFYSNLLEPQRCMEFTRSTAFCFPTKTGVREQPNIVTSYMDASNVYGSDDDRINLIRSFERGKLRVNSVLALKDFPPTNAEIENLLGVKPMVMGTFLAGDDRVNEMPGLLLMHTLWLREHNRIADLVYELMPNWSDEVIFQETRRLVIAEWQNVVYGEYLPALLGQDTMKSYGLILQSWWSNYNPNTDASTFHAFADAAYRFGHTFINGLIQLFKGSDRFDSYRIRDNFFVHNQVTREGGKGLDYIMDGLLRQNAQTYDRFVTEDLTNFVLRLPTEEFGADLIARNIHRGRDHGLPPYMEFRKVCGLSITNSWASKPIEILHESWARLQSLYNSPEDIDLFTGGLVEVPKTGALTGTTFNCLKAMQFKRLKDGDRFFFTHGNQVGSFWEYQIQHIRQRTFGDIICENSGVTQTQRNVFLTRAGSNIWIPCNSTARAKLDLNFFIH